MASVARAADPPIDIGGGYDRLAEAMDAEGIIRVRRWRSMDQFSVELVNGYIGTGKTIREAIANAAPVLA
jgi:hypothetical protein